MQGAKLPSILHRKFELVLAMPTHQLAQALANLPPKLKHSRTHDYNPAQGWLPMVAPEFIVLSSVGGKTLAHPIRAPHAKCAIKTWQQSYFHGRIIGCATREGWAQALAVGLGEMMEVDAGDNWAGPGEYPFPQTPVLR